MQPAIGQFCTEVSTVRLRPGPEDSSLRRRFAVRKLAELELADSNWRDWGTVKIVTALSRAHTHNATHANTTSPTCINKTVT